MVKTQSQIEWVSPTEAAKLIRVTPGRVRQLIDADKIRWKYDPNRTGMLLVDKADARRYRDSPRKPGPQRVKA